MGRVVVVAAGAAVVALQVWLTLYAQVVLAYEAAVVLVVLVALGLRARARSRRPGPDAPGDGTRVVTAPRPAARV